VMSYLILPAAVEWYAEANDEELVGRRLEIGDIDFNLLTGGITIEQLTLFEPDKQTPFVQFDECYVNLELWQMMFGTFGLSEVSLRSPIINIRQQGSAFNVDDLTARFAAGDTLDPVEPSEPVSYRVQNMSVSQGVFSYEEIGLHAELTLVQLNISCPLVSSDDPKENVTFDFRVAQGGKAGGVFQLNNESLEYRTEYALDSLNVAILFPYLVDYMRTGKLSGLFTSHQVIAGNFNAPTDVATSGMMRLNDFALTDPKDDKLVGVGELKVEIDSIDLGQSIYAMKYVGVEKPYLKVELYDEGNNFTRLMKEKPPEESGISSDSLSKAAAYGNIFALMAAYVRELSRLYAFSDYHADSLALRGGTLIFNDFTLHNRFNYLLEDLMVKADKVTSDENIKVEASSVLNTSGRLKGQLLVDPHGFSNMAID